MAGIGPTSAHEHAAPSEFLRDRNSVQPIKQKSPLSFERASGLQNGPCSCLPIYTSSLSPGEALSLQEVYRWQAWHTAWLIVAVAILRCHPSSIYAMSHIRELFHRDRSAHSPSPAINVVYALTVGQTIKSSRWLSGGIEDK